MPDIFQFKNGNQVINTYTANGQKLRTKYYTAISPVVNTVIVQGTIHAPNTTSKRYDAILSLDDYMGSILYVKGTSEDAAHHPLTKVLTPEGYVDYATPGTPYCYFRKDHLGSIREVVSYQGNTRTVVQKTLYYPSGTPSYESFGAGEQPYKFTGKEMITMHGLNWQDYGARWLDNVRLQWTSVDPLAEKYYSISPYAYCAGNPVNRIDPDGRVDYKVNSKGEFYQANPLKDNIKSLFGIKDQNDRILMEGSNKVISKLPVGSIGKIDHNNEKSTQFEIKNNAVAEKVILDVSRNTSVEWARVEHSTGNNTSNTIVNDHKPQSVNSGSSIALDYEKSGEIIPYLDHSHQPITGAWNERLEVSGQNGEPGDMTTAKLLPNTIQRVLNVSTNQYEYYNEKGVYRREPAGN